MNYGDNWDGRQIYQGTSPEEKCQMHLNSKRPTKFQKICLKIQWQHHMLARKQDLEGGKD